MTSNATPAVLMCVAWEQAAVASRRMLCDCCAAPIAVSNAMCPQVDAGDAVPRCLSCTHATMEAGQEVQTPPAVERELRRLGFPQARIDGTATLLERLLRTPPPGSN